MVLAGDHEDRSDRAVPLSPRAAPCWPRIPRSRTREATAGDLGESRGLLLVEGEVTFDGAPGNAPMWTARRHGPPGKAARAARYSSRARVSQTRRRGSRARQEVAIGRSTEPSRVCASGLTMLQHRVPPGAERKRGSRNGCFASRRECTQVSLRLQISSSKCRAFPTRRRER